MLTKGNVKYINCNIISFILGRIIISENLVKVIMNGCEERMYVKVSR